MNKAPQILEVVALGGKNNSSTGHENDSLELEFNNIACIVLAGKVTQAPGAGRTPRNLNTTVLLILLMFLFSPLISEFPSLMTDRSDVF